MKGQEWYQADEVAAEYDDKRFSGGGELIDRREKEAVLEAVTPLADKRVLEIACGTGRFTVMLAEQGADVVGLDISEPMLKQGLHRARQGPTETAVEFLRGDAGRLPFPDDHFDTVVAMRFFHLADDPATFLEEMRRVTRNQIVFDTFNHPSTRSIYNWALPMGSRLYTRREVEALLEATELTAVDVNHDFLLPYGFYRILPGAPARAIHRFERGLASLPGIDRLASISVWNTQLE